MFTLELLFTKLLLHWHAYGKQAFFLFLVLMLLATIAQPNLTVFANGATGNV